jgi:hypothetical protein
MMHAFTLRLGLPALWTAGNALKLVTVARRRTVCPLRSQKL